jgi:ribulose-phosphate 3-epimerase
MFSVSFLSINEDLQGEIKKLDKLDFAYFHLDIMDGKFVPRETYSAKVCKTLLKGIKKPLDVHLMVNDITKYVDDFDALDPEYITFQYEASKDPGKDIKYIKSKGIKAGISIKPNTPVSDIKDYLDIVDLVLVMSVEPGAGGQAYLPNSKFKVNELRDLRDKEEYDYLISIDGGINPDTINDSHPDMYVVGSYITNGNYKERLNNLKECLNEEEGN